MFFLFICLHFRWLILLTWTIYIFHLLLSFTWFTLVGSLVVKQHFFSCCTEKWWLIDLYNGTKFSYWKTMLGVWSFFGRRPELLFFRLCLLLSSHLFSFLWWNFSQYSSFCWFALNNILLLPVLFYLFGLF